MSRRAYPSNLTDTEWAILAPLVLPLPSGFQVLPRRRLMGRIFAWRGHWRRLSEDSEALSVTTEA